MKDIFSILRRPVITEKSNILKTELNKYVFEVSRTVNKKDIKESIEKVFKVSVINVNIMNMSGKKVRRGRNFGKRPNWKKALVTLKKGDTIEFFEGA